MEEAPVKVTFTKTKARRAPRIALVAIAIALAGLGLALVPSPEGPPAKVEEPASPSAEADNAGDRILEAGRDLTDAIRHALTSPPHTPTPTPAPLPLPAVADISSGGVARLLSVILGLGAVLLGALAWFMREPRWACGVAILLGVLTVALNAVIIA